MVNRNLLIVAAIVIVFIGLPMARVNLSTTAIVVGFGVLVLATFLDRALRGRQVASARTRLAADPGLRQGSLYVAGPRGRFYSLDPATGAVRWTYQIPGGLPLAFSSTATVADGLVFVGAHDGAVYALAADWGSLRWRFPTNGSVQSRPAIDDGNVFLGSDDRSVYALRVTDGSPLWCCPTDGAVRSDPAVADRVVYVGSDDHHVYAIAADNGEIRWRFKTGGPVAVSPTVVDGVVFVGSEDHLVYALDARDGAVRWRLKTGGPILTSPAVSADVVVVGSRDQHLYALDAATGKVRWRHLTGGGRSSPTIVDGVVYVGSGGLGQYQERASQPALFEEDNVWALRLADGKLLWRHFIGTLSAASSPTVAHGVVYVATAGNSSPSYSCVYALDAKDGKVIWTTPAEIGGEFGVSVTFGS
jgi:outer membrane protein assembly factor BamB